jgi:undecaprenyl diphosphate synthase
VGDGLGLDELAEHITPAAIDQRLYTAGLPDPGLIIRASGEVLLSGFLLWQCVHSEFYFTDVYWSGGEFAPTVSTTGAQRFRSLKTLQKFSSVHAQVHNQFNQ